MRDLFCEPGCEELDDLLPELLHGRLAGEPRARAERHVAGCARCASELAVLRGARDAVRAGAPAVDLAAVAAAVRTATTPAGVVAAGRAAGRAPVRATARPAAGVAAASRSRIGPRLRALAATALVAVGGAALWVGRPSTDPPVRGDASLTGARAPAGVAPAAAEMVAGRTPAGANASEPAPPVLASADPGLGTPFDDLSDEELQAVLAAVEGAEQSLPSAEPPSAAPELGEGG